MPTIEKYAGYWLPAGISALKATLREQPREMGKETLGVFLQCKLGSVFLAMYSMGQSGDAAAGISFCCCSGIQHLSCSVKGPKPILLS